MPTDAQNLATIKSNYLSALAADSASPGKDYSIDGQSVSRAAWRESLFSKIKEINELMAIEDGPWEHASEALT